MSYRFHGSEGTPDLELATEAELADAYGGYLADDDDLADRAPRLLLVDHGNLEGWVSTLPGGSDDLFAFAARIEDLAKALSRIERGPLQ